MKRIFYLIVLLNCLIKISQAQVKTGAITGLHIYKSSHYSDVPILGVSNLVYLHPKIILSLEYQTFSSITRHGTEFSSPHITVVFWRNERITHQILSGIHYQIHSVVPQPIFLLGLNLGNEWYQYNLQIVETPTEKDTQITELKKEMLSFVIFPSIAFIREWKRFNLFFQFRFGSSFIYSDNSILKYKKNYAQLLTGVFFKLI